MDYTETDRPAFTDAVITDAMLAAGSEAFVLWFRQLHLEPLLVGLPEAEDVASLSVSMYLAMTRLRPDA